MSKSSIYGQGQTAEPKRNSKPFKQQANGAVTTITIDGQSFQVIDVKDYQMLRSDIKDMESELRKLRGDLHMAAVAINAMKLEIQRLKQQANRPRNPWE